MKTLVESLFDKDLVQKNLPVFGDLFEVEKIRLAGTREALGSGDEEIHGRIMKGLDAKRLKHDIKPINLMGVPGYYNVTLEELQYLLAAVANITILPSDQESWKPFAEILKDEIKEIVKKYKKGYWVNSREFMTMFLDPDGLPYIRLGISTPYFVYLEIYYKKK